MGAPSHPWLNPVAGQNINSVVVEGIEEIVWAKGSIQRKQTVSFQVQAWQPLGGQTAKSQAAAKYLLRQVEELSSNRDLQPVFIQWTATDDPGASLNASDLHDGWYIIDSFEPDYKNFVVSGIVMCRMTVTEIAMAPPRSVALAYAGGALASNYSGASENMVALPFGSTALEGPGLSRRGAEGLISCIFAPVASPQPFVPSTSIGDLFKGGVHVYDTISTSAFAVPTLAQDRGLFRSLGTDATGTLNWWSTDGGSPSISANVVTLSAGSAIHAGHADWDDGVTLVRFQFANTAIARICVHFADPLNHVFLQLSANNMQLYTKIAGTDTSVAGPASPTLAINTWYWARIEVRGFSYSCTVYTDAAGALGTAITNGFLTGTITSLPRGVIALQGFIANCLFGGAFSNVCLVTGPTPGPWAPFLSATAIEPAFCWSSKQAQSGARSLSVFFALAAGGSDYAGWSFGTWQAVAGTTYTYAFYYRATGTNSTSLIFSDQVANTISVTVAAPFNTWLLGSGQVTVAAGGSKNVAIYAQSPGAATYYFDNPTVLAGATPIFGDGFEPDRNANWVEVFGTDHDFVGDCAISNGLQLLLFRLGLTPNDSIANLYLWNTALAVATWQAYGVLFTHDNTDANMTLRSYSLIRAGAEESAISLIGSSATGQVISYVLSVKRGRYEFGVRLRPLSATNPTNNGLILAFGPGGGVVFKIAYNSSKIADQVLSEAAPAVVTDYGYGAGFINSATYPFVAGLIYQNEPGTSQPGFYGANSPYLSLGDNTALAVNAERTYAVFAIPYGAAYGSSVFSTAHLQAECESGQYSGGFVTVADAAASGGNAAKVPITTAPTALDTAIGPAFTPSAGTYVPWFRLRTVVAGGSATGEFQLQVWNVTDGTSPVTLNLAPNQVTASYAWYKLPDFTPNQAKTYFFRIIQLGVTTTQEWRFDEAVLVPKTLTDDKRGPQNLWQQFMYDRDVELIAA